VCYLKNRSHNKFLELINDDNQYSKIIKNRFESIKFVKQDPMKQLTGTFNPQVIEDIEKWYKIGGYYDD
jgi:hypothetical protein